MQPPPDALCASSKERADGNGGDGDGGAIPIFMPGSEFLHRPFVKGDYMNHVHRRTRQVPGALHKVAKLTPALKRSSKLVFIRGSTDIGALRAGGERVIQGTGGE